MMLEKNVLFFEFNRFSNNIDILVLILSNNVYDIDIKIEFQSFHNDNSERFIKDLESKFKENLQIFMNQLETGNGKVYDISITKKE